MVSSCCMSASITATNGAALAMIAFDDRPGQAPPADAAQAMHPRVAGGDGLDRLGGAVRRIVVDDHQLPAHAHQRRVQLLHQPRDIVPLVEGGRDHGQGSRPRPGRAIAGRGGWSAFGGWVRSPAPFIAVRKRSSSRLVEDRWPSRAPSRQGGPSTDRRESASQCAELGGGGSGHGQAFGRVDGARGRGLLLAPAAARPAEPQFTPTGQFITPDAAPGSIFQPLNPHLAGRLRPTPSARPRRWRCRRTGGRSPSSPAAST